MQNNPRLQLAELLRRVIEVLPDAIPALKTMDTFQHNMTNDVHALYSRAMSRRDFTRDMTRIITNQLTEAWNKGADEMLVLPEDMTDEDTAQLQAIIDSELSFLDGLADDIQQAQSDRAGWEQFSSRIDIWVNRFNDTQNEAKLYFGGKTKLVWRLGATEKHCTTCSKLDGIVAFAYEWDDSGVQPQAPPNDNLECHGWQCDCSLDSAGRQRRTTNALDKIKQIVSGQHD